MNLKIRVFNPIEMLHTDEEIDQFLAEICEHKEQDIYEAALTRVASYRNEAERPANEAEKIQQG